MSDPTWGELSSYISDAENRAVKFDKLAVAASKTGHSFGEYLKQARAARREARNLRYLRSLSYPEGPR